MSMQLLKPEKASDKKRLNTDRIRIAAMSHFLPHVCLGCPYDMTHPEKVGQLARAWADLLFLDEVTSDGPDLLRIAQCSGYLIYHIRLGRSFEDCNALADHSVATVVARLTPDIRLPLPNRRTLLHASVASFHEELADVVQLVKFCEIELLVRSMEFMWPELGHESTRSHPLKDWAEEQICLLKAFERLESREKILPSMHNLVRRLTQIEKRAADLQRRGARPADLDDTEAVTTVPLGIHSLATPRPRRLATLSHVVTAAS